MMESREQTTPTEESVEEREQMGSDRRPSTADIAAGGTRAPDADEDSSEQSEEASEEGRPALLADDTSTSVRGRWETIQGSFVDEPRRAVEEADALVADLMQQLADSFATERRSLEGQWDRGDEVSTEELRIALQRYRSFFDRLLSA